MFALREKLAVVLNDFLRVLYGETCPWFHEITATFDNIYCGWPSLLLVYCFLNILCQDKESNSMLWKTRVHSSLQELTGW